ncbi:MAG: hypothetical protein JNJ98_20995, partial [Gemmatimonadetes bacterium]|nr:hypothetical protein [Gemmatimonadota bacterium]
TTAIPAYPASVKSDAVLRMLRGTSVDALSAELSIPVEQLEMWRLDFLSGAMKGLGG